MIGEIVDEEGKYNLGNGVGRQLYPRPMQLCRHVSSQPRRAERNSERENQLKEKGKSQKLQEVTDNVHSGRYAAPDSQTIESGVFPLQECAFYRQHEKAERQDERRVPQQMTVHKM